MWKPPKSGHIKALLSKSDTWKCISQDGHCSTEWAVPPTAAYCCHLLLPPVTSNHHQPDLQTAQRECSEYQTAIRKDCGHIPLPATHPRHWFCSRANCCSVPGYTTRFSTLFNCSENSSSLLGCIISIICNAPISNHQIRQISNRHAINNASTWDHRLKRTSLHKQGSIYTLCTTVPNVSLRNYEPRRTNNGNNARASFFGRLWTRPNLKQGTLPYHTPERTDQKKIPLFVRSASAYANRPGPKT